MYWTDDHDDTLKSISGDIVDMQYGIRCQSLPVDHAHALYEAIESILPWIKQEEGAGIHPIHVADSGNGWVRPENPNELLHLSRRTKLLLRLPGHRIGEAEQLVGKTLMVAGHALLIEKAVQRPLSPLTTVFSRYVVSQGDSSEEAFMARMFEALRAMEIKPPKMLAGRAHLIVTPEGDLPTRSLMMAGLSVDESVKLQQLGLGSHRHLGCGLFIPHKDISEVRQNR